MAYRPNLIFGRLPAIQPIVRNNGSGVAKHCLYITAEPKGISTIQHTALFDLGPGEEQAVPFLSQEGESRVEVIEDLPSGWTRIEALVCEDMLGNRYRFFGDRPADVWRHSKTGEPPRWTAWH